MPDRNKARRGYGRVKRVAFSLVLLVVLAGVAELAGYVAIAWKLPHYEKLREVLSGARVPDATFQKCIGQAYLHYVPSPHHADRAGVQHNAHGYRGDIVPLRRRPGVLRILALGGSTTYCYAVPRADQTYPAHLARILRAAPPSGYEDVEVINGGLPWGTTAEILTHYHFKYAYYEPDVVIINTGGNDGELLAHAAYHPDYSHVRQPMHVPRVFPVLGRWMLKSRFLSVVLIAACYGTSPGGGSFVVPGGSRPPPVRWYPDVPAKRKGGLHQVPDVPAGDQAFVRNLEATLDEISRRGSKTLLVPFRLSPGLPANDAWMPLMEHTERQLESIAAARGILVAPYPASVVSTGHWVDHCHLNAAGCAEKAAHVATYVRKLFP